MEKGYKILFIAQLILLCLICSNSFSQFVSTNSLNINSSSSTGKALIDPLANRVFIEEQGQFKKNLAKDKIIFAEPVLFGINNPEFNAYFTASGITFLFAKPGQGHGDDREKGEKEKEKIEEEENEEQLITEWEILSFKWLNHNAAVQVHSNEKVKDYYTYGRFSDGSQYDHVSAFKKIVYESLFDGVDAEFELPEKGGIKYRFIVHAGHKIPAIAYKMEGAKNLFLDEKGDLHVEAAYRTLIDKAPNAFVKNTEVPISYKLSGNIVEFFMAQNSSPLKEDLIIDPWIVDPSLPGPGSAYDVQEDSSGNVFIYGSPIYNYQAKKYNSAGVLQWTHTTSNRYYCDIAVGNSGSVYLSQFAPSRISKLDQTGAVVFSVIEPGELWRLAFNKSKTILALGAALGAPNLSKVDTANGSTSNNINYNLETRALATDCNGDMYSLHCTYGAVGEASSNLLRKTNANFTPGGSVVSGLLLDEVGTLYTEAECCMGINGIIVQGPYIYIYDGINLRRFNKSTLSVMNSVTVPNGLFYSCSGIAADFCGNIYVGTMSSIEVYDPSLNHLSSILAPNIVYDVLLAKNGDLLACGKSFVANLGPTCAAPLPLSVIATSTDVSCSNGTALVVASGGSMPYSYLWQPGGQTTALDSGLVAGTYTYTVNDAFCHTVQDSVVVLQATPFSVSIGTVNNETCLNNQNGTATLNALGGGAPYTYSWNTNPVQTTQTAIGLSAGTYVGTAYDAGGCVDTASVTITVNSNPIVAFSNSNVCNGSAAQFSDSTTTFSGAISGWIWNFGDGTPVETSQNPSHTYANAGNFNVSLVTNNNFGCVDSITKAVQVFFSPTAGFSYSDVCSGDTMYFTDTSFIDNSTSIASYLWVFGDASPTNSAQNPNHYYSTPGTYSVILLTTSIDGCSNATTIPVKAFDKPTSAFTFSNACLSDSAVFTNTSLSPTMGNISNLSWDFGDGAALITSVLNPGHLYTVAGNYEVTLINYSSNLGCSDTLKDTITVFPGPLADFSFANECSGQPTGFNDLSTVSTGSIITRSWNFGDGSPFDTNQSPNHIYSGSGIFTVTLTVTTVNGCKDSITKSTVVHPLPVAQYNALNVCEGSVIQFNDVSAILASDTIGTWLWDFGDGNFSINQNTSHLYSVAGSYPVQLLVVSNFGCTDSVSGVSIVNARPIVNFTGDDTIGCEPLCVNFQNFSSVATGTTASYLWNFGDGTSTSNAQNPVHCYTNSSVSLPSSFIVTLTVNSDNGCMEQETKNNYITVHPNPEANFLIQPEVTTITIPTISITNLSVGADIWNWNFGDTDISSSANPQEHTYADTGTFNVILITSTLYGCMDTASKTVIIEPDFLFYIPNAFTPNGDGINDTFTGKGTSIKEFEMRIFDRWGEQIYKTNDINKPWKGTANERAEIVQRDVYVYSFKIVDFKMVIHNYRGIITLVR